MIQRILFPLLLLQLTTLDAFAPNPSRAKISTTSTSTTCLPLASIASLPQISNQHLQELAEKNYVIIPNFLPTNLQESLRQDVANLRQTGNFNIAKIGQDSTNTLNQNIRVAETCFIGGPRPNLPQHDGRTAMIQLLQTVCRQLSANGKLLRSPPLDPNLSELLYAYYPQGGFYRRHRDAIPGSASVLRTYSLLLYLNENWQDSDAGQLRIHLDGGADDCPPHESLTNFVDVAPQGGTLVLFDSTKIPHEVLDTNSERLAIVGWYNRELSPADIAELGGIDPMRMGMMAVAAAFVTVGLVQLLT